MTDESTNLICEDCGQLHSNCICNNDSEINLHEVTTRDLEREHNNNETDKPDLERKNTRNGNQ